MKRVTERCLSMIMERLALVFERVPIGWRHAWSTLILLITTAAAGTIASSAALAQGLTLGTPSYGGSGCPQGSASTTLSPDQKQLSILFDQYLVQAGGMNPKVAIKSCNIAIPINVPQGLSVSLFRVDYRGYTYVPEGGRAQLRAEYFFAGQRGPSLAKMFFGPADDLYTFTNNVAASALVWSPCGAQTNLRVNTNMIVNSNLYHEEALATVDSADVTSGLLYHIQWRSCGGGGGWPF